MKKLSKFIIILMIGILFISPINGKESFSKEEIVYSKMNYNGSVESVYVVNAFDLKHQATIVDYGPYTAVVNTSTNQKIESNGIKSTIKDVEKGRFFYQGTMSPSTQLPWLLDLTYYLDDQLVNAKDLGGKSGHLKIDIKAKENKNVNDIYFNNYLLTITFNIDSKLISNLKAKDATIGNAGDKKTIVFTGMPKTEAHYILEGDIQDFQMDGIQIAALPFSMAIDMPDIGEFATGLVDLNDGIHMLNVGGAQKLVAGSAQIKEGIESLSSGLNDFVDLITITPEQQALIDSVLILLDQLEDLIENDFGSAGFLPIAEALKKETVLALFPQLDPNDPNTKILLDYMDSQAQLIEVSYDFLGPYQEYILKELVPKLKEVIMLLESIEHIPEMVDGVAELNGAYYKFHQGLEQLSEGIDQLDKATSNIGPLMEEKINELMADYDFEDFDMASFVDDRNETTSLVQFVYMTQPIQLPKVEEQVIIEKEKKSFWNIFLDLFR